MEGDAPVPTINTHVPSGNTTNTNNDAATSNLALPSGWRVVTSKSGTQFFMHADGRKQKAFPAADS